MKVTTLLRDLADRQEELGHDLRTKEYESEYFKGMAFGEYKTVKSILMDLEDYIIINHLSPSLAKRKYELLLDLTTEKYNKYDKKDTSFKKGELLGTMVAYGIAIYNLLAPSNNPFPLLQEEITANKEEVWKNQMESTVMELTKQIKELKKYLGVE